MQCAFLKAGDHKPSKPTKIVNYIITVELQWLKTPLEP